MVQGTDNFYYLHHTFPKEYNSDGSIYPDVRNTTDFFDSKNIIYGYNMKNGSIFHVLRKFQNLYYDQENREIWIYLPDGSVQVYELVECEEVNAEGETYELGNRNANEMELILSAFSSQSDWRMIEEENCKNKGMTAPYGI